MPHKTSPKDRKYTPKEIAEINAEGEQKAQKSRLRVEARKRLIKTLGEKEYRRRLT